MYVKQSHHLASAIRESSYPTEMWKSRPTATLSAVTADLINESDLCSIEISVVFQKQGLLGHTEKLSPIKNFSIFCKIVTL